MKKPHALIGLLAAVGTVIGIIVAIFGLPYGRLNYTAFAHLYNTAGTPIAVVSMDVDCNTSTSGVQSSCTIFTTSVASIPIDVVLENNSGATVTVDSFNYDLYNGDTTKMAPTGPPVVDTTNFPATDWNCAGPAPVADTGAGGAGTSVSRAACVLNTLLSDSVANGGTLRLSGEPFSDLVIAPTSVILTLLNVAAADDDSITIVKCVPTAPLPANPTGAVGGNCFPATLNFVAPPPATNTPVPPTNTPQPPTLTPTPITPTLTPTSTNTLQAGTSTPPSTPPEQHKTCQTLGGAIDGSAGSVLYHSSDTANGEATPDTETDGNANAAGNECNLFICIPRQGPPAVLCDQAGEGHLVVLEQVSNVHTNDYADANGLFDPPDGDGVGAYEFQVEFDSFVIESVNPVDLIFNDGCPNPGDITVATGCYRDGSAGTFGPKGRGIPTCSFSIAFENSVRFGCVTLGQNDGPNGAFNLAKLDLIPAADDVKDLFPGNDNGIPTLVKDNQCELADILGHPVLNTNNPLGSIPTAVITPEPNATPPSFPLSGGAGQLPICGDLLVTVRILEGDLNLDCKVDVEDEAIIALHYGAFFGSTFYLKWFDLEPRFHDLDIDIKDLQKVFGRDSSTCEDPIPLQTPVHAPFDLNS